ncbi:hypothetical protein P154DRAFT_422590, partial [Amniculicola lignicola CBS 123094]
AGSAIIKNRCPYPVYVLSEDSERVRSEIMIPAGTPYEEPIRKPSIGGVSFKVSKVSGKFDVITQLEYTVGNNENGYDFSQMAFYDISFVDCVKGDIGSFDTTNCPAWDMGISIVPPTGCAGLACPAGTECLNGAYYVDFPPVKLGLPDPNSACTFDSPEKKIIYTLCDSQPGAKRSVAGRISYEEKF